MQRPSLPNPNVSLVDDRASVTAHGGLANVGVRLRLTRNLCSWVGMGWVQQPASRR